ncbi:MAG TPA: hypothetical protein VFX59_14555 [Polyangiales bacterium]|nr:hypothetical protein [Polyangiales bacterium]
MTTAKLWLAIATAVLATLSACSDVESCLEGQPGCRNGAPDESGNCKFGLVLSNDGSTCVRPGEAGSDDEPDGGATCSCPSGQLCRKDGICVNLCTPASNPPTPRPTLLPCEAPDGVTESFARIALALCYQTCVHRAVYCGTACDPATECTQLLASAAARTACQGNDDPSCAKNLCERARDLPCASQQCPLGAAPSCAGTLCNDCDESEIRNDGICDDGDPSNAISYLCDYGSDCGDCGPRRGSAPPRRLDVGDVCADWTQCGGDLNSVKTSTGWCVPTTSAQSYARCVPDCSNGKKCTAGFECVKIVSDEDGDGPLPSTQYKDYNDGTLVFGCFPLQCGG